MAIVSNGGKIANATVLKPKPSAVSLKPRIASAKKV